MSQEQDQGSLGALMATAAAGLPAALSKSALGALNRLVAGVADIPATYLAGWKERVEDKNYERRQFRRALVDAAASKASSDPELVDRTVDRLMNEQALKQFNRESIAREAASQLSTEAASISDEHASEPVDEDWINKFIRYSEDASSERLQLLFAKILAGEIVSPGTFSPKTLRAVSELTQSLALDFQWIWAKRLNDEIWKGPEFKRGDAWVRLTRLRDAGFLSPIDAGIHQPDFMPKDQFGGLSLWRLPAADGTALVMGMKAAAGTWLPIINFTDVGLEIGGLLPPPDYEANLRAVAAAFPKNHVAWIRLQRGNRLEENLWSEAQK